MHQNDQCYFFNERKFAAASKSECILRISLSLSLTLCLWLALRKLPPLRLFCLQITHTHIPISQTLHFPGILKQTYTFHVPSCQTRTRIKFPKGILYAYLRCIWYVHMRRYYLYPFKYVSLEYYLSKLLKHLNTLI